MAPLATKRRTHRCRRCGKERKWHVCTAGGPQQPPTAGQVIPDQSKPVDIDRISDLPDELLCTIVSLLPFKDGARTRLLSRRWRNLWLSAPLNLDDGGLEVGDIRRWRRRAYLQGLITRILSTHPGPIRRLCLTSFSHTTTWDTWFRYPVLDKLEELQFRYNRMPLIKDLLPLSALRFSDLRVASYGRCNFPEDLGGVTFPKLRELTLYELTNSESTLHAMISACPALRSLFLRNNVGFRRVRISSQRLINLGISVEARTMEELIIVNAPSMEKLLIFDTNGVPKNICVMFAPKLEVMGCLSNDMLNVQLEATVFQKLVAISPIKSLQAVKIFSLRAAGFKLEIVMDFLKCFPCLEKLYYFESRPWEDESGQILNGGPSIECLDRHLKEIVLIDYQGTSSGGVNFVRFFVLNASVLKVVEFQVPFDCSKKWKAKHKRLLPKRKDWASQVAKLNFVHGTYFRHWQNEYHTHELFSYDNPFGCQ
ncbi:hypothetical protein BAE44_0013177 [Dichanthelium oligosanthes]|uniref:F-box domain-containing protein n=1 Tax=Dichanthelium oligosanthes TaxID=888268 RepID=A0A1E5VL68_9POAL|nr:hypothetical protein BAE44_0013177 [Dichanthelium oligosanthes]